MSRLARLRAGLGRLGLTLGLPLGLTLGMAAGAAPAAAWSFDWAGHVEVEAEGVQSDELGKRTEAGVGHGSRIPRRRSASRPPARSAGAARSPPYP